MNTLNNINIMILGLTGYYASGKSTVSKILEQNQFQIIDLDLLAHQILIDKQNDIIQYFGYSILNTKKKEIDRSILGKIVFSDRKKLKTLENIIYPILQDRVFKILEDKNGCRGKVIVSSVLYKVPDIEKKCMKMIFVQTPLKIRILQGMKRDRLTKIDVLRRMKQQKKLKKTLKKSHVITIHNNNDLDSLKKKIEEIIQNFY